jgi:hypothetical protein
LAPQPDIPHPLSTSRTGGIKEILIVPLILCGFDDKMQGSFCGILQMSLASAKATSPENLSKIHIFCSESNKLG